MGHGITEFDRYGEVRKNGKRAWHGLGQEIEEGLSAEDGFQQIGLGWPTILCPIFAQVPDGIGEDGEPRVRMVHLDGQGAVDENGVPSRPYLAHLRADTLTELGVVKDGYQPFENLELARFADALAGADAAVRIETAGSLYRGRKVFALVRLPEAIRVSSNDPLEQYILLQNGHGGYAAFSVYPTSVRVVCANTLRWSERDISKGLRFRHTGTWEEKIKVAKTALGLALNETKKFQEQVMHLRRTDMSFSQIKAYMSDLYDSLFGKIDDKVDGEAREKLLFKRTQVLTQWEALLDHPSNTVDGMSGTAWQAYNAVSFWEDHQRGRFGPIEESDARVASNVFGVSHKQKRTAFEKLLVLSN